MTNVVVSPAALPFEIVSRYVPCSGVGRNAWSMCCPTAVMVNGDFSIHT
jgi:hypothetical protein